MTSPRTTTTSTPRRGRRILATGLAVGMSTMALAPAAMAAKGHWSFTGATKHGANVLFTDGKNSMAALLEIDLDGQKLDTYCIQRKVITKPNDGKTEVSWAESGIVNLTNVAWILHNSVPGGSELTELNEDVIANAGTKGLPLERDGIDMREAVQGTQAAIWHVTDEAEIHANNDVDVKAVYAYLTDTEVNEGMTEAHHSVKVTGPGAEIWLGDTTDNQVGPFVITSDLEGEVAVVGTGGELVNAAGTAVTTAQNGDELWVTVDSTKPGTTVTVTASGKGAMVLGRVFAPIDPDNPTQTLITASTNKVTLSDTATTNWYVTPSVELPEEPIVPEVPVIPELPEAPVTPEKPVIPELPEVPERPETVVPEPEQPETVSPTEETDEVEAVDEAEETEELARTGGSLTAAILGAGLLAGGAAMITAKRRSEA
ncbi:MAG TPA: Cys-Gln thioester bond-forming surface protein [Dermatophilaceae bacterium]|nr:Cys-Gln thioester bond-forming surface protein [Dermatophilaceae bacterium]